MSRLNVTIERHRGMKSDGFGSTKEVDCGQYRVFVNGQLVGYAPDEGHISIIRSGVLPEDMEFIKSEVERLRGQSAPSIVQVPTLNESNVELVEDDEEPLT